MNTNFNEFMEAHMGNSNKDLILDEEFSTFTESKNFDGREIAKQSANIISHLLKLEHSADNDNYYTWRKEIGDYRKELKEQLKTESGEGFDPERVSYINENINKIFRISKKFYKEDKNIYDGLRDIDDVLKENLPFNADAIIGGSIDSILFDLHAYES